MPKQQKKLNKESTSGEHKKIKEEERRQRDLVKNVIYPFLVANSKSIEDAKSMVYATDVALQGAFHLKVREFQIKMSSEQVSTLNLSGVIKQDKEFDRDRGLISLVENETIATATALLGGLKQVIEGFQREEGTKRTLDTLKTDFL